jgi:hypothetical protein
MYWCTHVRTCRRIIIKNLSYQKPERPSSQQTKYTSDASVDLDSSFEKDLNSNNNKTKKMGSEEWGFALPPPAEFSDTPENYGEEPISVTSIDADSTGALVSGMIILQFSMQTDCRNFENYLKRPLLLFQCQMDYRKIFWRRADLSY